MKNPGYVLPLAVLMAGAECRAELVARWTFDEPAGATTAGNGVEGGVEGIVGAGVTTGEPGIAGNAYRFAGATATQDDIVDMGNAPFLQDLQASGQLSFTAWVRTSDTTGNRNTVVFAGDEASNQSYADLGVAAGLAGNPGVATARNRPNLGGGGPQQTGILSTGIPVNDDEWHHLVMTVDLDSATLALYVDGELAATQTMPTAIFPAFNNFEIGRLGRSSPVDPFEGLVDDVQVYDHALTADQVAFLHANPGESYSAADSDVDGLPDTWEIFHFGTIEAQRGDDDFDGDGADNLQEFEAGTDPTVADTDGDGRSDGDELNTPPLTNPLDPDSDGDGLSDGEEVSVYLTDPNNPDSDGDGLPDGWEIAHSLDPNSDEGDDGGFGDPDGDGLENFEEYNFGEGSTDPHNPDTDGDGYTDLQEDRFGTWGGINQTGTDPNNPDSDGDGLLDGEENPDAGYVPGVSAGTDPNVFDTDGDGFNDKAEFEVGSDPTDPNSFPVAAKGLVAHYKFDEAGGASSAEDELGRSPGAVGSGVTTGEAGVAGNAYRFQDLATQDGIVDMGNAGFLAEILSTGELTFAAWIRSTDTSSGRNTIISAANSTAANSYVDMGIAGSEPNVGALSGRLRPDGNANIAEIFSSAPPAEVLVNDDGWHHVVLTLDLADSTLRLYVDGAPVAENAAFAASVLPAFNNFEVGRLGRAAPTDAFGGLVDDVQIYNEALTAARIADLYAMPGVSADEDHDRLDDQWEILHFGSVDAWDGTDDPDGDGFDNEAEETAGTDPTDAADFPGSTPSSLRIVSVRMEEDGSVVIEFAGAPETPYAVTKSEALESFAAMEPPVTATTGADGRGTAVVPAGEASALRAFFRIEAP